MRMLSVGCLSVDCFDLIDSGAPGMRPNLNKVVYYQYLSEAPVFQSGPKSGPFTSATSIQISFNYRIEINRTVKSMLVLSC